MVAQIQGVPTLAETLLAQTSSARLARALDLSGDSVRIGLADDRGAQPVTIPSSVMRLLMTILAEMAKGNAVAVIPAHAELTSQEAGDILNVSRPYLIGLLERGEIAFRKVGTRRRVRLADVLEYKREVDAARLRTLGELTALDQELGLGE